MEGYQAFDPNQYNRVVNTLGARLQLNVSSEYTSTTEPDLDTPAYYQWDQIVTNLVNTSISQNLPVEWDIWNEPNNFSWWNNNEAGFFGTWKSAYNIIRANIPNAVIVGPSDGAWRFWKFLRTS